MAIDKKLAAALAEHIKLENDTLGLGVRLIDSYENAKQAAAQQAPATADTIIGLGLVDASRRDELVTKLANDHEASLGILVRSLTKLAQENKAQRAKLASYGAADLGDADPNAPIEPVTRITDLSHTDDVRVPAGVKLASDQAITRFAEKFGGYRR